MPAETVVDIVLDVPGIFHGNVCCCLPICDLLIIPDWNILQIFRKQKLEVFYKSNRSTLINAVMKYLNFRSRPQSWRALNASLLKVALRQRYLLKNFTLSAEQQYSKMHQDGCFSAQLFLRNIPQWLRLKDSCKDIFILEILGYSIAIRNR